MAGARPAGPGTAGAAPAKARAPRAGAPKPPTPAVPTPSKGTPPKAPPAGGTTGTGGTQAGSRSYRPPASVSQAADDASGVLLAFILWGWIVLPFLKNGAGGVKDVLRAKFFNKAPDGSWLP